jgi:hypothetical protein
MRYLSSACRIEHQSSDPGASDRSAATTLNTKRYYRSALAFWYAECGRIAYACDS